MDIGTPTPLLRRDGLPDERLFVVRRAAGGGCDLRLSHDGMLLGWTLPQGLAAGRRRAWPALRAEDHPLDPAALEGAGAGDPDAMEVWDCGSWENISEKDGDTGPVGRALARGRLAVSLHGHRLRGAYVLHRRAGGSWLLTRAPTEAELEPVEMEGEDEDED